MVGASPALPSLSRYVPTPLPRVLKCPWAGTPGGSRLAPVFGSGPPAVRLWVNGP